MRALSRTADGEERKSDWQTPRWFVKTIEEKLGKKFDLDVMASGENAICDRFVGESADAFFVPWRGKVVWCNPPDVLHLGAIWRAIAEARRNSFEVCVMLVRSGLETEAWDVGSAHSAITHIVRPRLNYVENGREKMGISKHSTVFFITPHSARHPTFGNERTIELIDYRRAP